MHSSLLSLSALPLCQGSHAACTLPCSPSRLSLSARAHTLHALFPALPLGSPSLPGLTRCMHSSLLSLSALPLCQGSHAACSLPCSPSRLSLSARAHTLHAVFPALPLGSPSLP